MSQTLKVVFECELPSVPNFLRNSRGESIPIEAATDEALRGLGKRWTQALVAQAQRRRKSLGANKL